MSIILMKLFIYTTVWVKYNSFRLMEGGDFLAYKGYCLTYWATWGLCDPGAPWENVTQLQAK